jgi:hypothetical protein
VAHVKGLRRGPLKQTQPPRTSHARHVQHLNIGGL